MANKKVNYIVDYDDSNNSDGNYKDSSNDGDKKCWRGL